MTGSGTGRHGLTVHDAAEQMRREFIEELAEALPRLDMAMDAVRNGHGELASVVTDCRRMAIWCRGQAANFAMHRLATVAHRLEEYLASMPAVAPPRFWDDLAGYMTVMGGLASGEKADADPAALVRALPAKLGFGLEDIEIRNVEVLLVMPHGAQTRFVERELQQCGYRVSLMSDSLRAFAMVVETKPDLVIISAVMPDLEGIDLTMALSAMPSTRNIPLAVITSLAPDDEALKLLPKRIPVLFKGPSFADDLFKALDNLFLI